MTVFEYKVIPAPLSGKRAKGVKGANGRFANALSETLNELAVAGWEYVRAESLPSIERKGVTRKRIESYQNVLVFRRETQNEAVVETTEDADGFNPFKRFNVKKEPVMTAAAVASTPAVAEDTVEEKTSDDQIIDEVKATLEAAEDRLARDIPAKPTD